MQVSEIDFETNGDNAGAGYATFSDGKILSFFFKVDNNESPDMYESMQEAGCNWGGAGEANFEQFSLEEIEERYRLVLETQE